MDAPRPPAIPPALDPNDFASWPDRCRVCIERRRHDARAGANTYLAIGVVVGTMLGFFFRSVT